MWKVRTKLSCVGYFTILYCYYLIAYIFVNISFPGYGIGRFLNRLRLFTGAREEIFNIVRDITFYSM